MAIFGELQSEVMGGELVEVIEGMLGRSEEMLRLGIR